MNSSGPGAQRIKDAGVWFIQITIAKYLFNQNNGTAQLSGFGLWALSVALATECAKIFKNKNARAKCATPTAHPPHIHIHIHIHRHTHTQWCNNKIPESR